VIILLIAGLWLDGSAWDGVVEQLGGYGHDAVPITLPGQGAAPPNATLEDQHARVLAARPSAQEPPDAGGGTRTPDTRIMIPLL
jgi:hypothetical protein